MGSGRISVAFPPAPVMFFVIPDNPRDRFNGMRPRRGHVVLHSRSAPGRLLLGFPWARHRLSSILRPRSASRACETTRQSSPFTLAAAFCCIYQWIPPVLQWLCMGSGRNSVAFSPPRSCFPWSRMILGTDSTGCVPAAGMFSIILGQFRAGFSEIP